MKVLTASLSLILIIFCFASFSFALEVPEEYTKDIANIEFYPNGARFEFHVETENGRGKFRAIIPGAFDPSSIRLLNPEDVFGDIMVVQYPRTRWTPSQLEAIKAQQEEQAKTVDDLTARQSALEQTLTLLKSSIPDKANPPAIITYIRDAYDMRLETENELAALKVTLAQEKEKLNMLTTELNTKRPRNDNSYIEVTGEGGGTIMFEAFTRAASWRPKYTMNLDTIGDSIEVHMFAIISQRTGLDYNGNMTLHTKVPDVNIINPEVEPLKVGIKPKEESIASTSMVNLTRSNRMYKSAQMNMMADKEDLVVAPEAANAGAGVQETLSDRTVDIDGAIPGDGTERELEVIMSDLYLSCKPVIVLIPEQKPDAWIIASMDEGNEHLIPGEAELRVDNHSSGKIYLEEYGIGQKRIPFGYAEQITGKKERLVDKTGVSWFSGVFTSGYKLEITNGTKDEQVVTVRDRLPIPTDDKIKLDVKRIEPKEKERDAENRLTWELTVPAGGTVPIIVDYTLSYPSGEDLQYK